MAHDFSFITDTSSWYSTASEAPNNALSSDLFKHSLYKWKPINACDIDIFLIEWTESERSYCDFDKS